MPEISIPDFTFAPVFVRLNFSSSFISAISQKSEGDFFNVRCSISGCLVDQSNSIIGILMVALKSREQL